MTKRNETTLAACQVPGPPLPNFRFQVWAKETSLGGSAGPGAKSVLAMGSKRDQPMGLVLRAWLYEAPASLWGIQAMDQEDSLFNSVLTPPELARD